MEEGDGNEGKRKRKKGKGGNWMRMKKKKGKSMRRKMTVAKRQSWARDNVTMFSDIITIFVLFLKL